MAKMVYFLTIALTIFSLQSFAGGKEQAPSAPKLIPLENNKFWGITDEKILGVLLSANKLEIQAGQMALRKAHSQAVKSYASKMIADHTKASRDATQAASQVNIRPEGGMLSNELQRRVAPLMRHLQGLSGKAFDETYMDYQIQLHQQLLDASGKLIGMARHDVMRTILLQMKPVVQNHLKMAKEIKSAP